MPSHHDKVQRYRRKSKAQTKFNAELREKANRIHELERELLEARYPLQTEIAHLKMQVDTLARSLALATKRSTHILLWCPKCGGRHIDKGAFATKAHRNHACQHCGLVFSTSTEETIGVEFLPGYKDE